jgi:RimJ/RimL family protein N-acetyltransferase
MIPRLDTPRLILRAHTLQDFPAMAAMWADAEVTRFILGPPATHETTWARLMRYAGHWQMLGFGYWAVECRDTGAFFGDVGLADWRRIYDPPEDPAPEAGWVLARAAHGRGLAAEAMGAVLGWADATLPARRITAIFAPEHAASLAVARRLGFGNGRMTRYQGNPTLMLERLRG